MMNIWLWHQTCNHLLIQLGLSNPFALTGRVDEKTTRVPYHCSQGSVIPPNAHRTAPGCHWCLCEMREMDGVYEVWQSLGDIPDRRLR